ncbi:MAG: thymidylate kinase [Ruminococcaceae bacterium]|nr:thymidylate kinase [Oscillospiraceae bacterium]
MGRLITIDGLDASGKETQSALLCRALRDRGYRVRELSFPMYGERSAVPVELYLGGALGDNPEDTNAYAASTFFSVDRYISYRTDWKRDLEDPDTIVVTNRYTTANAVHQLSKLPREKWESFLSWLWDFEFGKLGLPVPDCILYLEMRPDIARRLLAARSAETGRVQDIHEKSADHLEKSYRAALYASDTLGWNRIRCFAGDEPRPIADIHAQIMDTAAPYLT